MADSPHEGEVPLEAAIRRLEQALAVLDGRVTELSSGRAEGGEGGLFDVDRSQLAAELDACRARERALEDAGAATAEALDRAIGAVRAAMQQAEGA